MATKYKVTIPVLGLTFDAVVTLSDDGYTGEVAQLPGCASQGNTLVSCQNNLADAAECWLEVWAGQHGLGKSKMAKRAALPSHFESSDRPTPKVGRRGRTPVGRLTRKGE